jgi:hypothetical protein
MMIELVGALSLPVWLCVEEVIRLREQAPLRAAEAAPSAAVEPPRAVLIRARDAANTA